MNASLLCSALQVLTPCLLGKGLEQIVFQLDDLCFFFFHFDTSRGLLVCFRHQDVRDHILPGLVVQCSAG